MLKPVLPDNSPKELSTDQLDEQTTEIAQQIISSNDVSEVQDLTKLFNLNAQKRNVARVMKMNQLLDTITDNVVDRFNRNPANFSNDDLLRFMQVTETSIDKATKKLSLVEDTPTIQYNQNNQVNINLNSETILDRESRQRVTDAIQSILSRVEREHQDANEDVEFVEVDEIEETEGETDND